MKALLGSAVVTLCLGLGAPSFAWWGPGHMEIAAQAYGQLDPEVRETVDRLIKFHPEYAKWTANLPDENKAQIAFMRASTWADDIKNDPEYTRDNVDEPTAGRNIGYADHLIHDYWHHIDIPFSPDGTEVTPPDVPNALTQIEALSTTLASDASDDLKSYDVVWLVHLVGDLHQPLHATTRFTDGLDDDRGGNAETVQPTSGPAVTLHAYWDGLLGDGLPPTQAISVAEDLPEPDPMEVAIDDPTLWVIESFTIAQNDAYTGLIGPGAGPFRLTRDYEAKALMIAQGRAALAGARLARLLNASLK